MKYKFDVLIENTNYPLIVLYKVKTFSEYGVDITSKSDLATMYDPNVNSYRKTVEFSITNWMDGNNVENHNNLSCIGSNLTIQVYAFQQGHGDDFSWITPESLRNPENYANWESFKTAYVREYTFTATPRNVMPSNIAEENYISIRKVARVAIPASDFPTSDDIQTKTVTLKVLDSNGDVCTDGVGAEAKATYTDFTFTKSTTNPSYFVSDILNFDKALSVLSTAVKIVCEYADNNNTTKQSCLFTTILDKFFLETADDKFIIDENIDDNFEIFFDGENDWEKYTDPQGNKYTFSFGGVNGPTARNYYVASGYTAYKMKTVCTEYTPETKSFYLKTENGIFGINPIYCFVDANGFFNVKQVDVLNNGTTNVSLVNYGLKDDESTPLYYELNT